MLTPTQPEPRPVLTIRRLREHANRRIRKLAANLVAALALSLGVGVFPFFAAADPGKAVDPPQNKAPVDYSLPPVPPSVKLVDFDQRLKEAKTWQQAYSKRTLNIDPPPIGTDKSIQYDYDVVYVRVPNGEKGVHFAEFSRPTYMSPGGDLVLLHPDGKEEVLVIGDATGSVADLYVSFDGEWVYYTHFKDLHKSGAWAIRGGGAYADIYKVHVKTRKIVQLTHQECSPNTGVLPLPKKPGLGIEVDPAALRRFKVG